MKRCVVICVVLVLAAGCCCRDPRLRVPVVPDQIEDVQPHITVVPVPVTPPAPDVPPLAACHVCQLAAPTSDAERSAWVAAMDEDLHRVRASEVLHHERLQALANAIAKLKEQQ